MAFKKFGTVAAAAVLACLSMGANAGLVGSLAAFEGVTDMRTTENLEGLLEARPQPLDIFAAGGVGGTAVLNAGSSGATSDATSATPNNFGRHFGSADNIFWDAGGQNFYIAFTTAISAFGFDGADIGDFNGANDGNGVGTTTTVAPLTICLANSADLGSASKKICESVAGSRDDGGQIFAGIYDNRVGAAYNFVHFVNNTNGKDGQAFDNFIAAIAKVDDTNPNPTPEPAGLALVGLGLLGLASTRRRR